MVYTYARAGDGGSSSAGRPQFDRHSPSATAVESDANKVRNTTDGFETLSDDVVSKHNEAKSNVEGEPRSRMDGATSDSETKSRNLYRRAIVAGGALQVYSGAIESFNDSVDGWNRRINSAEDDEKAKEIYDDHTGDYTAAVETLEDAATTGKNQLTKWDDDKTVKNLWAAGALPTSATAMLPGIGLEYSDLTGLPPDLAALSDKELAEKVMSGDIPKSLLPLLPGHAKELVADDVADDVKNNDIDTNTVKIIDQLKDDEAFAHRFYQAVSLDELSDSIESLSRDAFPNGSDNPRVNEDSAELYKNFLTAAGATFATYSKATGQYAAPSNLSNTWYNAITSDKGGQGAALTLLLRAGGQETSLDSQFLADLSNRVYEWERNHHRKPVWGIPLNAVQHEIVNPFATGGDGHRTATDGLANLLGAMEHTPDAAQQFFSTADGNVNDDRLNYLLTERTFSEDDYSDEGDGLGAALRAAAVGDREQNETIYGTDVPKDEWSASFTSDLFNLISEKSGTGGHWYDFQSKWHIWPDMADDLGTIAAGYKSDVYDIVDGSPATGPAHLQIDGSDFDKVLGEIGRGDKAGIETLSTAMIMEGNERLNDAISEWQSDHPNEPVTMEALADSGLGMALQGRGSTNGEVLGHILNKSVLVDLDDEEVAETRAAYVSKAIDVAAGLVPGGVVLGDGASELSKAAFDTGTGEGVNLLKDAVEGEPSATADDYRHQNRETTSRQLEYNILNQLIRNGYLVEQNGGAGGDETPIPDSLLVDGPNDTPVINPDLYDEDGVETIGDDGQYTDAEIEQMRDDWNTWRNSQERNLSEGIVGQAQDGFDRTLNQGP